MNHTADIDKYPLLNISYIGLDIHKYYLMFILILQKIVNLFKNCSFLLER